MSRRPLSLEQLKQVIRVELCADCPFRNGKPGAGEGQTVEPQPCEAQCQVFEYLSELKATAERLDPLVGQHERALLSAISRILRDASRGKPDKQQLAPLRYYRRRLAQRLGKLLNH